MIRKVTDFISHMTQGNIGLSSEQLELKVGLGVFALFPPDGFGCSPFVRKAKFKLP